MHPRTIRSARIRCVTATGNSRESPSISDTTVLRDRLAGWAADRRVRWGAGIFGGLALGLVILIGAFPWGALKGVVENRLGARYGAGVTIGSIDRKRGVEGKSRAGRVDHGGCSSITKKKDEQQKQTTYITRIKQT